MAEPQSPPPSGGGGPLSGGGAPPPRRKAHETAPPWRTRYNVHSVKDHRRRPSMAAPREGLTPGIESLQVPTNRRTTSFTAPGSLRARPSLLGRGARNVLPPPRRSTAPGALASVGHDHSGTPDRLAPCHSHPLTKRPPRSKSMPLLSKRWMPAPSTALNCALVEAYPKSRAAAKTNSSRPAP